MPLKLPQSPIEKVDTVGLCEFFELNWWDDIIDEDAMHVETSWANGNLVVSVFCKLNITINNSYASSLFMAMVINLARSFFSHSREFFERNEYALEPVLLDGDDISIAQMSREDEEGNVETVYAIIFSIVVADLN